MTKTVITPYNVCLVLWGIASVHVGANISTAKAVQYCEVIASVLWGIASVLRRLFSTAEGWLQYMLGDSISTVEVIQYCRGIAAVLRGIASVHMGDNISTVEG